jgi:hypothetical protein
LFVIDWWGLFHNSLWVLGLAACLASLSMASYEARVEQVRLHEKLGDSRFQLPVAVGAVLFCLGLLASGQAWWERAMWGLLAALCAVQALRVWRYRGADSTASRGR